MCTCGVLNSIPGCYPLGATNSYLLLPLVCDNQACLQALPNSPWGTELSLIENYCFSVRHSLGIRVCIFHRGGSPFKVGPCLSPAHGQQGNRPSVLCAWPCSGESWEHIGNLTSILSLGGRKLRSQRSELTCPSRDPGWASDLLCDQIYFKHNLTNVPQPAANHQPLC